MNHGSPPSLERVLWTLVIAVVALELLAAVLPWLLPTLIVLALVAVAVRLVWWYTQL